MLTRRTCPHQSNKGQARHWALQAWIYRIDFRCITCRRQCRKRYACSIGDFSCRMHSCSIERHNSAKLFCALPPAAASPPPPPSATSCTADLTAEAAAVVGLLITSSESISAGSSACERSVVEERNKAGFVAFAGAVQKACDMQEVVHWITREVEEQYLHL